MSFLEFEQPIAELEAKIDELKFVSSDAEVNIGEEIARLRAKSRVLLCCRGVRESRVAGRHWTYRQRPPRALLANRDSRLESSTGDEISCRAATPIRLRRAELLIGGMGWVRPYVSPDHHVEDRGLRRRGRAIPRGSHTLFAL